MKTKHKQNKTKQNQQILWNWFICFCNKQTNKTIHLKKSSIWISYKMINEKIITKSGKLYPKLIFFETSFFSKKYFVEFIILLLHFFIFDFWTLQIFYSTHFNKKESVYFIIYVWIIFFISTLIFFKHTKFNCFYKMIKS